MHLAIDVREACRPKRAGKGQWTAGFVGELLSRGIPLTLFSDTDLPASWALPHVRGIVMSRGGMGWHWDVASRVRRDPAIDLFVSPTSYVVPWLLGKSKPYVLVVHDLIAFRGEPHDRKAMWIERFTLKRAAFGAAHILTISAATKRDLLARYPALPSSAATVVYAGPLRERPAANIGDRKTILCVGTLCPRKNQERLISAYRSLSPDLRAKHDLLLAGGRGWRDASIVELAASTPGVIWEDYISDERYEEFLTHCAVFALPSLYEGFGMQVLDALQRGMPVLTSAKGSLGEVTGGAALLVDPESVSSIREGLERLLTDASLREDLRRRGPAQASLFTWKRTVDLFLTAVMNEKNTSLDGFQN